MRLSLVDYTILNFKAPQRMIKGHYEGYKNYDMSNGSTWRQNLAHGLTYAGGKEPHELEQVWYLNLWARR